MVLVSLRSNKEQREIREKRNEAQDERNKLVAQRNSLRQKKDAARTDITTREGKLNKLQREFNDVNVDEGQQVMARSKLDDNTKRLNDAREELERADYDGKMRELNKNLYDVEGRSKRANEELVRSNKQAEARAKIGIWKKEVENRDKAIEIL